MNEYNENNQPGGYNGNPGSFNNGYGNPGGYDNRYSDQGGYRNSYNNDYYVPEEYRPISMWGYFGYTFLFSIPLIGFILICIFSFGGARNINLRNFARSFFCWLIIALIIIVLSIVFGFGTLFTAYIAQLFSIV